MDIKLSLSQIPSNKNGGTIKLQGAGLVPVLRSVTKAIRKPVLNVAAARSLYRNVGETLLSPTSISGNVIQYVPAKQRYISTYHYDPRVKSFRPISEAERLGIPKSDRGLFDWSKISDLRPRFNKWAEYYGYGLVPESANISDAVNIMKNTFKRHNTFFRGLIAPDKSDAAELEKILGKNFTEDQAYAYMSTTPRIGDNAVFASPIGNALIYGANGKTAIIRRNYHLGKDPSTWLKDSDFNIRFGGTNTTGLEIKFPWNQHGIGLIENEVLIPRGQAHFVGYVPDNFDGEALKFIESNGSLNKYLGNKSYHDVFGFGPYDRYTDVPVEKPIFKQGGILERKIIKAQNGLGKIPIIGPALKRLAYKIITNPKVQYQGGATSKDIKDAILNKSESLEDDNKSYFIWGVDRPETELGNAYDWSNDIKENKYKNVKAYQGILNPYNEYVLNERDKGLVDELAKHNYTAGLNINMEYSDPVTEQRDPNTPMFDDVHGYRVVFHKDENGNPVISASDLYDFGKNYKDGFKDIFKERSGSKNANKLEWQRRLLNKIGQPYLLVQKNIPIRYTNNPIGNEINRVNGFTNQVLDRMSDEDIAKATNSGLITASKIIK